ncbi:MAG: hypothetical protein HY694_03575 [Deltaproteobacteria bacterium]|nr:hypothetical protein [Deltaproteobacteria bacterium]
MARKRTGANTSKSKVPPATPRFVVKGQVRDKNGYELKSHTVGAYDKGLSNEKDRKLGEAVTNRDGKYEITYTYPKNRRAKKEGGYENGIALVVRVLDRKKELLVESSPIFNPKQEETVDLMVGGGVYKGDPEYKRYREALDGLVDGEKLSTINDEQKKLIAGKSGIELRHIEFLVAAEKLSAETAGLRNKLEPEVLYGLLRQNLPTNLTALLSQHPKVLEGALRASLRDNVISLKWSGKTDAVLDNLRQFRIEKAMKREEGAKPSLGELLLETSLPDGKRREFLQLYFDHEGRVERFWEELERKNDFKDHVADSKFTFELTALTQNHLPMLRELKRGGKKSRRDLAGLDEEGWTKLIKKEVNGKSIGVPPDVPGDTPDQRIENYAKSLAEAVEKTVPTAVFASRLKQKGIPGFEAVQTDLNTFFTKNPNFKLGRTYIEKDLPDNSDALADILDKKRLREHLKKIQRVFKLTPRFDDISVFLKDGIHSAQQIVHVGRSRFIKKYEGKLGKDRKDVELTYVRSVRTMAKATMVQVRYSRQFNRHPVAVFRELPEEVSEIPNWTELFGSLSFCECEHCRSMYSPAAYLADLLHFIVGQMMLIRTENLARGETRARVVLFNRRPDIQDIELSCKNTNTVVPYIDLVNEILENAIAPGHHDNRWPQTDGTAEELSVNPEHVNGDAYDTLASQVYPWNLPLNLWVEEARAYLGHLGVNRYELMETFQRRDGGQEGDPTDTEIASEYLGLTTVERNIITDAVINPPREQWQFYGYATDEVSDPENPNDLVNWVDDLSRVPVFLKRSGLSYFELLELLAMKFINPVGVIDVEPKSSCNLQEMRVRPLHPPSRNKIYPFLRLWRKLGWTMRELDQAITALEPLDMNDDVNLTEAFLQQLSHIKRMHDALNVPLVRMLSWWGNIDTAKYTSDPSLYEQLFLNKAVMNPVDNHFTLAELAANQPDISGKTFALLAALGISDSDLSLLTNTQIASDVLHLNAGEVTDGILNLANLSHLYRIVSFSKAVKLSIREFLSLKAMTGINPFDGADLASTLRFVEVVHKVHSSGFSIPELDYLLRHVDQTPIGIGPTEQQVAQLLKEIEDGLKKIVAETTFETTRLTRDNVEIVVGLAPAEELLRGKLAIVLSAELIDTAIDLIKDDTEVDNPEDFIRAHFNFFPDVGEAITNLVGNDALHDPEARLTFVLARLMTYLRQTLSENFVKQKLENVLRLESETIHLMLMEWVKSPADVNLNSIDEFLYPINPDEQNPLAPEELFRRQFNSFILLHKIATIVTRFKIRSKELRWISVHGPEVGWLDLVALPIKREAHPQAMNTWRERFHGWERLLDGYGLLSELPALREKLTVDQWQAAAVEFNLSDRLDPNWPVLFNMFSFAAAFEQGGWNQQAQTVLLDVITNRTGWNVEDLIYLAGPDGFNLSLPAAVQDEQALIRLNAGFKTIKRIGVSASQIWNWSRANVPPNEAPSIKRAVKAKYDNDQWLAVAKPISDILREKQRAALVSYLTSHPIVLDRPFEDSNELFNHFLIDVEMSPCMMTSRIKQAIGSVQLFIQRCLMNLESAGYPDPEEDWAVYWRWMKNYRVWEASRKVFLYPENWIEPELRDDKSPFFKDLENELLQNEVTTDTVETAFKNYLEKLDAVARLEISGMYHQVEEGVDILHVFGRTQAEPHIYYYRQRVDAAYWTPWQRVDLDIQDDHLIPVVWNRRLYLFWPIFTEKAEEGQIPEEGAEPEEKTPRKYWEIQMAWSEYKNGKWAAKNVTTQKASTQGLGDSASRESELFTFKSSLVDGDLDIIVFDFIWPIYEFHFKGCNGPVVVSEPTNRDTIQLIGDCWIKGMKLVEVEGDEGSEDKLYLESRNEVILNTTPGTFSLLLPHQDRRFVSQRAFFYQDDTRTFFVTSRVAGMVGGDFIEGGFVQEWVGYLFHTFYPPYVCEFLKQLNRYGIDGLLQRPIQLLHSPDDFFDDAYDPQPAVLQPNPIEDVDVSAGGAYSLYNWELFFHAPLLIADRLSKNQRFEEAQKWFHYIFDPTDRSDEESPQRYWKFRKFYDDTRLDQDGRPETIHELIELLHYDGDNPDRRKRKEEFEGEVDQWRLKPFNPHLNARLRSGVYQRTVVMKYIDNLIAWGDQLFRRDTIESINEATLLYILAAEILGDRPPKLPPRNVEALTYAQLEDAGLDVLSNAAIFEIEGLLPVDDLGLNGVDFGEQGNFIPFDGAGDVGADAEREFTPLVATTLYFCVPPNEKLLGYWDTVADRLFKIRHCMTIEGVVRQLPLFEPPIEPGLLVRAAAAGVDISSALNDISAALPHYRFNVMLQKAIDLCNDIKALGAALLSAIEKRDAEELALLRSSHELELLTAIKQVKEQQINEANETLEGLRKAKVVVEEKHKYYLNIARLNPKEQLYQNMLKRAHTRQNTAQLLELAVAGLALIPELDIGVSGWAATPVTKARFGGINLSKAAGSAARVLSYLATLDNQEATMASIEGGYDRRWEEWKLQEKLANKELDQIDKQIEAAKIRKAIAEKDLENHDKQIENTKTVEEYMRGKFTNKELYDWMVGQISSIYFQSYQLAYDVAKRAERAFRHELGLADSNFIQFGYWDSLKKGLLAGEKLHYDLKRMEMAYLDQNKREYEITKHISLAMLDPIALVTLKETGDCFVNLPEAIFDVDHPGHYMRRLKSVSLTIPCVVGPYTSVNCTLTLLSNRVRQTTSTSPQYAWLGDMEDNRFRYNIGAIQSIATSSAQNDSGVFELNFRDERYLPFEGAGAISTWRIELSKDFRQFDYDTISDVVLHIRYTARDGGSALKRAALEILQDAINQMEFDENGTRAGLFRLFSARHEFPNEWHRFLHPKDTDNKQTVQANLTLDRFPFQFRAKEIEINAASLFLKVMEGFEYDDGQPLVFDLKKEGGPEFLAKEFKIAASLIKDLPYVKAFERQSIEVQEIDKWFIEVNRTEISESLRQKNADRTDEVVRINDLDHFRLNPDVIEDIYVICHYSVS